MNAKQKKLILVGIGTLIALFGIFSYFTITEFLVQIEFWHFIVIEIVATMIIMGQIGWLKGIYPGLKNKNAK